MIISTSRNFIFLHIHKTGGGAIAATLEPYLGPHDLVLHHSFDRLPRAARAEFRPYASLTKHSSARDAMSVIPREVWDTYYKFAFVRDPIERAISFYNFCADQHAKRAAFSLRHAVFYTPLARDDDPRRWPGIRAFDETSSFSEFLRHPEVLHDTAMQPQFDQVCDAEGRLAVDFVGHHEHFDRDLAFVQQRVGIPVVVAPPENVTKSRLAERSTLTQDDRALLSKLYEVDFAAFGYER